MHDCCEEFSDLIYCFDKPFTVQKYSRRLDKYIDTIYEVGYYIGEENYDGYDYSMTYYRVKYCPFCGDWL